MKCPPQNQGQVYEQKGALPTEDWHLPSTSTKIKSWPLQLLTFNSSERGSGWKSQMRHSVLWEKLAEQAFRQLDLFQRRFYESQFLHLLTPRETLTSLMVKSALTVKEKFTIKSQNRVAMAPHSSTLAWRIPWTEEPGGLQSMGSLGVGYDWATSLSCTGEGNGNPLQCSCLENPRDGGAWWAAVYGVT